MKLRREVLHDYEYDKFGRLIHDQVALLSGSAVDNAVMHFNDGD